MKKVLSVFGIMMASLFTFTCVNKTAYFVSAEEVIEKPCKVVIDELKGGDILADLTEGEIGDKVTFTVKANFLYKVESVMVNGVSVLPNEDGNYSFTLVEGENKISATFVIDNEELAKIANLLSSVKENGITSLLTMENLALLINWMLTFVFGTGYFLTLIKCKKIKANTIAEFTKTSQELMQSKLGEVMNNFLENVVKPLFEQYNVKLETTENICSTLARCFVLAQENNPQSRLAIIEELTKLNNTEDELAKKIKDIIETEISKNKEESDKLKSDISELKQANQKIKAVEEKKEDNYGQL